MSARRFAAFTIFCTRATWSLVGPVALVVLTLTIVKLAGGWRIVADLAYIAVLATMLFSRWIEHICKSGDASNDDLRQYLIQTTIIGLTVWAVATLWPSCS